MAEFLQQLLNGVSLGAIYALIALGYTMVYGVLGFINFAHSEVFMCGAFAGWLLADRLGGFLRPGTFAGGFAVLALAMVVAAVLGMLVERLAYRPLRGAPTLNVLITAIGVSILLQNLVQFIFGATPKTYPALFPAVQLNAGPVSASSTQLVVVAVAVVLMLVLRLVVLKTRLGAAMRAVAFNPKAAALVGIDVNAIVAVTFAIGSALAGAGGVLYALNYPSIEPTMGTLPGIKAFVAAVLGGIGNFPGAALGALLLGVTETFVAGSRASTFKDAIAFAVLILVLLFRPAGLLGRPAVEKV